MTEHDQDAAIGRLVSRHSELKRRRAALISEGREIAKKLAEAAQALSGIDYTRAFWHGREDGYTSSMNRNDVGRMDYVPAEQVNDLFDELRQVAKELRQAREQMKAAGIDFD